MIFLWVILSISSRWEAPQTELYKYTSVHAFHVDDQAIFVKDKDECTVLVFNHQGILTHTVGEKGQGPGQLSQLLNFYVRGNEVYLEDLRDIHV